MPRALRTVMVCLYCLLSFGCRTLGDSSRTSNAPADAVAAQDYIAATVARHFPDLTPNHPAVRQFATALLDGRTAQTESTRYVFEEYWQVTNGAASAHQEAFELYIVEEFLTHTNYLQVMVKAASTLQLLSATAP